ncbi:MAG: hypothetical protein K2W96_28970, partial [Gemmataceae bacterium]|nr:hypothetical protein [Gemmataceae bacterium]
KTVALVGVDALFVTKELVANARRALFKDTRIPGDHILVGANHTHSGGPVVGAFDTGDDPKYVEAVAKGVAAAVKQAWGTLHASEIGIGSGTAEGIAFNRRFVMRDGSTITHPGKPGTPNHANIVCPAGPVDPMLGVLAVRAPKGGKVRGFVLNFGCHSTVVGGNLFSPDYIGYVRKHLAAHYGADLPVCFLLGPCGDITQVDNQSPGADFGPEMADMMGQKLAGEAVRVTRRMKWATEASVDAATMEVPCALRDEPDPDRERPPFGLGSDGGKGELAKVWAAGRKAVAEERRKRPILPCEVQAVRVGDLGIATNGAEYFCEFGLTIKKASRHASTWVASLANEWIGYVPTASAFAAGGYEPRTATSSKLAPEAGQRLMEGALKMLAKVEAKKE